MRRNLLKMISYYKPYIGTFMLDLFFAFLASATALVIPLVVRYITSNIANIKADGDIRLILTIGGVLFGLVLVNFGSRYFISYVGHVMGAKIEYNMRSEIFAHYQKLSFSFYDEQKVGSLMSRVTSDLFDITELLHHGPENLAISAIKIIGAFIILSNISLYLTLAAFALIPIMIVYAIFMNRRMRRAFRENRVKIADINTQIEDNLSGIRVVKSFANEEIENGKFKAGNDAFLKAKKNSYFYMGLFHSGMSSFNILINVIVIVVGGVLLIKNLVDVPDFVAFLLYINVFTEPIQTLVEFTEQFQNGYTGFERFREIMDIEPDIEDSPDAVELKDVKGDIAFEDVSFK